MARHFLTGEELTTADQRRLLERAIELKADRLSSRALEGKSVALVFDKPSTRTRVSFETGVFELGGHPLILRQGELQMARGESPRDVALVLSRMVHAIGIRTGPHETVTELAEHASVPVINMLTHEHHPCQALADLMTLLERFGTLRGPEARLRGRREQHGPLAPDRRRDRRRGGGGGLAAGALAARGARRGRPPTRCGARTRSTPTCG